MKRTPFKRKPPATYVKAERVAPVYARLTVKVNMPRIGDEVVILPKEAPLRSETYRRLVASLPCIRCGMVGHSQAAHADQGKGAHIKADDRTCYPACASRPGVRGCHDIIGASGAIPQEQRRALEQEYAASTRKTIRDSGKWPKSVPHLESQNELELA
jgi:hypothetical protein